MRKITNKKNVYILSLVIIILLGLVISPTYAKFADSYITEEDIVGVSLNFNIGISNLEEYEEIEVEANKSETFNVEIENISSNTMYYGVWYRMVEPTTKDSNIIIARLQDTETTTSGSINSNETKTVSILIENNTDSNIKVDIGVLSSNISTSSIEYLSGKRLISGVTGYNFMINSSTDNFRNDTYKTYIKNATFVDYIDTSNASLNTDGNIISWDMSVDGNNSITAWLEDNETEGYYDLYIGSNRRIYAKYLYYFLADMSSLEKVNFGNLDTSFVTNMNNLFYNCSKLLNLDLSNFNTENVTNMDSMFRNMYALSELEISSFDTSNVETMSYMFRSCEKLVSLDISNFNTRKVTNMGSMFRDMYSLIELDISSFDTSNVKSMTSMFYGCRSLINLDLSNFNTKKVTEMHSMFRDMYSLSELDISSFDTSNVKIMTSMFWNGKSLISLDLSNFDTSKVTEMNNMFASCEKLTNLEVSNFDTSNVTNMSGMFGLCSNLISLDLSKWDLSSVININNYKSASNTRYYGMFEGCTKLTATITIRNINTEYSNVFRNAATATGTKITVNYTSETSNLVNDMITSTDSNIVNGNVAKGSLVS